MNNKERILRALRREVELAEDNYYRAKGALSRIDPLKEYGESHQSLDEIIENYKQELDEAKSALKAFDSGFL